MQSDSDVFVAAGGACGRSEGAADLAVRRPDLRLVQKREQARLHRPGRSWRAIGGRDLYLLQKIRYPDRGDGREFSEHWTYSGTGGMRLPNDQSRIDGRAVKIEPASRAEAHSGESEII